MTVASTRTAHAARKLAKKMTKSQTHPHGNYDHSPWQWGYVNAVNDGPTPTVDIYPDGSQNTRNTDNIIPSVKCLPSYVPTVGDVVLMARGMNRGRTSRIVVSKLNGAASPYPVPLGGIDSDGLFTAQVNSAWGAIAAPADSMGAEGDWCYSQNGHIYFKSGSSVWTEKV